MSEENTRGYYQYQDNNQYNGQNNNPYNNGQNDPNKKKKGKGKIIAIVVAIAVVVAGIGTGVAVGTRYLNNSSNIIGQVETQNSENTTVSAEDTIGSTNSTTGSTSTGTVTVTDVSQVVDNTMPSIVAITSKTLVESNSYGSFWDDYFGGGSNGQKYEQEAAGSGIIVDQTSEELLIVTNNHVVAGADSLKIQFDGMDSSSKGIDGYIKGTDSNADVAVVAVKLKDIPTATKKVIKKATLGDSANVNVGEGVIAIGNALGYGQSVTTGIISAKDREATIENKTMKLLQTDAAINGGNSGGALLNANGEVIGINVAKYSSSGSSTSASVEGMGFAIPISSVKNIISNLETKKTREKLSSDEQGYMGITSQYNVTDQISEAYSIPTGIFVNGVTKNGPAEKAGIQSGDVIRKFDGEDVATMEELQNKIQYYKPGEKVKVTIAYADGRTYKEKEITVTLAKKSDISK